MVLARSVRLAALVIGLALTTTVHAGSASAGNKGLGEAHTIVVKIKSAEHFTVEEVTQTYPVAVVGALLASKKIYFLRPTDRKTAGDAKKTAELAKKIDHDSAVRYAELDAPTSLADTRFHGWPEGAPADAGMEADWADQEITESMGLPAAHVRSSGAGTVVAVLDSGADLGHPALAGRLVAGYDYVDDDADPSEMPKRLDGNGNGIIDEAYGHGTFVAGMVRVVAPGASIMPLRVLNSDGAGSVFVVAQAIVDAVDDGADVINLSLGTAEKTESKVVEDALKYAEERGSLVVAAAGNSATNERQYPAQYKEVLSVTSMDQFDQLSNFACWGDWVDVAAPSEDVLGPVAGGGYARWSGTSMAAPLIAGQVALLRSYAPGLSLNGQRDAVAKSARKLAKVKLKYGVVNVPGSLDLLANGKIKK